MTHSTLLRVNTEYNRSIDFGKYLDYINYYMNKLTITSFEGKKNRRHWDEKAEKWYFAIMDIIEVLVQTDRPRKYWNDLKTKLRIEGSEVSEKIGQLKMQAADGKFYL